MPQTLLACAVKPHSVDLESFLLQRVSAAFALTFKTQTRLEKVANGQLVRFTRPQMPWARHVHFLFVTQQR